MRFHNLKQLTDVFRGRGESKFQLVFNPDFFVSGRWLSCTNHICWFVQLAWAVLGLGSAESALFAQRACRLWHSVPVWLRGSVYCTPNLTHKGAPELSTSAPIFRQLPVPAAPVAAERTLDAGCLPVGALTLTSRSTPIQLRFRPPRFYFSVSLFRGGIYATDVL
jgi:hypothetical protein